MTGRQPYDGEDDRALAGEYALGLLSPEDAAAFEARMVQDPELRALYAAWAEDFATLTDDIPEAAPPRGLLGRIEADLFTAADRPTVRRPFAGWRGLGWLVGGAAAAALLLLLAINANILGVGPHGPAAPALTAQIAAEDGSLVLAASYDAADGTLYVDRRRGAVPAGRALELWLIAGQAAPVSLGVLPEAGQAQIVVAPDLRGRLDGAVLAVSDEPPGGSPTGAPTGSVLATGAISPT